MTKREKRLQKIRQNPRNVRYEDLVTVMEDYGFTLRESGGSHVFADCAIDDTVWTVTLVRPHGNKKHVNQTYVKRAIKALDEIIAMLEETEEDSEDE